MAENNVTFNNNKGFSSAPNTGWTVASLIAQTSGIPLSIPINDNDYVRSNKFLSGAYSLGDLLENNGYTNEFLCGSDAVFGGRLYYYQKHGNYIIYDYNWALDEALITEDDYVWWGYEDWRLYEYAKKDLIELSQSEKPFNLQMLTADTHHEEGWARKYCENKYDNQYLNVYACASHQLYEFIEWCKQQDFYENTTIVVVGDHPSMDPGFSELVGNYDRRVYYTIINPAIDYVDTKEKQLCTFDFYPTTVAALGIQFEGNRLGLGTNLFSDEETSIEKYGQQNFYQMVNKNSNYYVNKILYGFE